MPQLLKSPQVATRSAAYVEDAERWIAIDVAKKCVTILTDVMVLRSRPVRVGVLVIKANGLSDHGVDVCRRH